MRKIDTALIETSGESAICFAGAKRICMFDQINHGTLFWRGLWIRSLNLSIRPCRVPGEQEVNKTLEAAHSKLQGPWIGDQRC